jgi:hypothetical protein
MDRISVEDALAAVEAKLEALLVQPAGFSQPSI